MSSPGRIASLISSGTEMLFALGLGDRVVAVSHECDYPPEARARPKATHSHIDSSQSSQLIDEQVARLSREGASLYGLNIELLCELRPDLIVTQAQCDVCAVRYADVIDLVHSQPALRTTRVVALNPQSLGDVLADITRLGQATGTEDAASNLVRSLDRRIAAVRDRCASLRGLPKVVCIEWVEPLMAAGNWTPELIALAGGQSGLAKAGQHSEYCTWDSIVAYDPDVLLIAPCGFDLARSHVEAQRLLRMPGWSNLRAVRGGRAYVLDGNAYLNRSGPRLVESLEILAHLFHPQSFPPPPLVDAWRTFSH